MAAWLMVLLLLFGDSAAWGWVLCDPYSRIEWMFCSTLYISKDCTMKDVLGVYLHSPVLPSGWGMVDRCGADAALGQGWKMQSGH